MDLSNRNNSRFVVGLAVWIGLSRVTGTAEALEATLGVFANDAFAPLNPAYILFVVIPNQLWPTSLSTLWYFSTWGFALIQVAFVTIVFLISVWVPRWFCRWLCPAAFLYGLFSKADGFVLQHFFMAYFPKKH